MRQLDDFEERMRRAATQAIVREAYHQTVGEQEDEQRRPTASAQAWRATWPRRWPKTP
ncbi:hypothetical protein [Nonomuraea sp. NPDC049750]|uniref:hypothetical protein n=1 Tax=Nonomuraea sp. NPDC049750 TaxID=3154738 RepID=UPI0033D87DF4